MTKISDLPSSYAHESAEGILFEHPAKPPILVDIDGCLYPMIALSANYMATVQAIVQYTAQNKIPPTVREIIAIKSATGRKSRDGACLGAVKNCLAYLESIGVIQRKGYASRCIRLVYPIQALRVKVRVKP